MAQPDPQTGNSNDSVNPFKESVEARWPNTRVIVIGFPPTTDDEGGS